MYLAFFFRMCWQEERKTEARRTSASLSSNHTGYSGASPRRSSHALDSSSDEDENYSGRRFATPWVSSSSQHPPPPDERIPTTPNVQLPPGISSPPTSDVEGSLSGFRQVDCPFRLRADDAFSSYRQDDSNWKDARRSHLSCPSSRRATLISQLFNNCGASESPARRAGATPSFLTFFF